MSSQAVAAKSLFLGANISAFRGSVVPEETIVAYLATDYRILVSSLFVLRIGHRSEELAVLYRKYLLASAAVVTAWNPYSEYRTDTENESAQAQLISKINRLSLDHLPAYGADPKGRWPPEPSRLVLGPDLKTAEALSRNFKQNGFVWVAAEAVPTLVLLR